MARRFIKSSNINSLGVITPEVVAIVSTKDNFQSETKAQKYFKRNYLDAIRKIIPAFYFDDDKLVSGTNLSPQDQLINSHIIANQQMNQIIPLSALPEDRYLSALNVPSGFGRFFYKQNFPASIHPDDFERNILRPLGKTYSSYGTSALFLNYVSGTLLPSFPAVTVSGPPGLDLATMTASAFSNNSSGTHRYLLGNLGWMYILNTSNATWDGFSTSNAVATLIAEKLWKADSIGLAESINIFQEYLWRHQSSFLASGVSGIIPSDYVSSVNTSTTYVSGSQLLDRLKILNEIIYSPLYLDISDNKVKESFINYIDSSALITTQQEDGPLAKFLRGASFSIADRVSEANELDALYDIGECPDQFLEFLAELIGWKLLGADVDKWRVQIRNAVQIYKQKGTKKSIQLILDSLFSVGALNGTGSDVLYELWESYIPDLVYYALATNSPATKGGLKTYTSRQAFEFGAEYSASSMDTNIRYLVDKILFDLVREFPNNFRIGKTPFPTPEFVIRGRQEIYRGPYHFHDPTRIPVVPGQPGWDPEVSSLYMTGAKHSDASLNLELYFDPNFTFYYRNKVNYIPPFEKRQYYTPTQVSPAMVDKVEYYLKCYGVDAEFARSLCNYIRIHTTRTVENIDVLNGFLFFTKQKQYPFNFSSVVTKVSTEQTPDPVDLLNLWNGKSSHFLVSFDASSFEWNTHLLSSTAAYGVKSVAKSIDVVAPAHAIPRILLTVSGVSDDASGIVDNTCTEIRPNFYDLYEGSGSVTTNFAVSALDMAYIAAETIGMSPNRFTRNDVKYPYNNLLSGVAAADQFLTSTRRNTLRRRNYHFLFPESSMFTRLGNSNPGRYEVSSSLYSFIPSSVGYYSLGFMCSSLTYAPINLVTPTELPFGDLLAPGALNGVWGICENLLSPNSFFGYDVSNTFASRAKQNVNSSDCNTYGRRSSADPVMVLINDFHSQEKYLEGSSIASGYYQADGSLNPQWPSSSSKITPNDLSEWFNAGQGRSAGRRTKNVIRSIGNQFLNNEIGDRSLNYYENYAFGKNVNTLFVKYITSSIYAAHPIRNNYNQIGGPNVFSHTYGPLIYNSDYEIDGSAIDTSSYLQSSSIFEEVDISYFGGSGVLSISGTSSTPAYFVGTYTASDASSVYIGQPEFRNEHLVSAVDLVDTSVMGSTWPVDHSTFSIFKIASIEANKYNINKYLLNNTLIRYQRPAKDDTLPRLRIKIDNSDTTDKARNFLQPNHDYRIDIQLHNLNLNSLETGGQSIGVLIRTEPEDDFLWIYQPRGRKYWESGQQCAHEYDEWIQEDVSSLNSSDTGIGFVRAMSQIETIPRGSLKALQGSGTGRGVNVISVGDTRGVQCWNRITDTVEHLPALANISSNTKEKISFKLSTHNGGEVGCPGCTTHTGSTYQDQYGKLHRINQKYVIEIFTTIGSADKFIVFDSISITDLTNNKLATILPSYGEIYVKENELKTIFRFFKNLQGGNASRNKAVTADVMDVNGGARSNYRSIVGMYSNSRDTNSGSLKEIHIDEG